MVTSRPRGPKSTGGIVGVGRLVVAVRTGRRGTMVTAGEGDEGEGALSTESGLLPPGNNGERGRKEGEGQCTAATIMMAVSCGLYNAPNWGVATPAPRMGNAECCAAIVAFENIRWCLKDRLL
ncbi:hypothetical protein HAX54_047254 [Datura stramonium]|uniref:Uncharacterized protein n=1 Tax=Datura stramonium TaxID=4076 RepID=A0ABS8RQ21_DATST|nr:hypothetical protein [Datura stramonium]